MVRGTKILKGKEAYFYSGLIEDFRKICYGFAYQEVIIPSLREQQTFTDKAGTEILNQMYAFKDKSNRNLCLIPEVTAIIQEEWRNSWSKTEKTPHKIFYVNRCYRYERPQEGRQREFTQFGVEYLGNVSLNTGFELIKMAKSMAELAVGAENFELKIGVKRGLSYYTEEGFEIECPILGAQKQVCGGGRYKEGIGFAFGIDRLLLAAKKTGRLK